MKFPKARENIYEVVRVDAHTWIAEPHTALLGAFSDLVEADNYKDACAAEWFDKKCPATSKFEVRLTTFYG